MAEGAGAQLLVAVHVAEGTLLEALAVEEVVLVDAGTAAARACVGALRAPSRTRLAAHVVVVRVVALRAALVAGRVDDEQIGTAFGALIH